MSILTNHGKHCHTCNQLAHNAHTTTTETGEPYTASIADGNSFHSVVTLNDYTDERFAIDEYHLGFEE